MRERLIDHVRGLFRGAADTPRNRELEEEILQNTLDRYDDLIAQGVSEAEAYTQAAANIGDVRNLWEQPVQTEYVPQPRKKRRIVPILVGVVVLILLAQAVLFGLDFAAGGRLDRMEDSIEQRVEAITEPVENWADNVEDVLEGDVPGNGGGFSGSPERMEPAAGAHEVDAGNITALDIDWIAGSVLVEVGIGERISIVETDSEEPLVWSEKNGVLSIDFRKEGLHLTTIDKDLTVQIPASLADSLSSIRISTTSADVLVDDLSLRSVSLTSVSGNLTADVECREFRADTTSGFVAFSGSVQDVEVDTVSGGTAITSSETPGEISVDTTSGHTTVTIPEDRGFEAEFDSVSGSFTCEHQAPVRGEVNYRGTASGEPAEFDFDTVSGNVEILKK